jgi:hypothetical protein
MITFALAIGRLAKVIKVQSDRSFFEAFSVPDILLNKESAVLFSVRFTTNRLTFRLTGFFFFLHPVHPVILSKKKMTAPKPLKACG